MLDSATPAAVRIAQIAARRHGIIDFAELREAGVPRSTIALWARSGRLHRLHRGVFSVMPLALLTDEARWLAAVKACGPTAVLSHGPAGQLHWIVPRDQRSRLRVTVADRSRRRPPGIVVHRPLSVPSRDRTTRQAIPVTAPTRTVWDLAATESAQTTRRAYERAVARDRLDRVRLRELLDACPNHRGARLIRKLLEQSVMPLSEVRSWLEELLLHICSEHGLPLPVVNVPLLGFEVDFLWDRERFVVEADGGDHLGSGRRDLDNERDIALGRSGYLVRRYSFKAMGREVAVAAEVRQILTERRTVPR